MNTSDASPKCLYCGSTFPHQGLCPSIKAVEYYPDGTTKRVELMTPKDYPDRKSASTSPIWPYQVGSQGGAKGTAGGKI